MVHSPVVPAAQPVREFYLQPDVCALLEPYCGHLAEQLPWLTTTITGAQLSNLLVDLLILQEQLLGKDAIQRDPHTHSMEGSDEWPKLPARLFLQPFIDPLTNIHASTQSVLQETLKFLHNKEVMTNALEPHLLNKLTPADQRQLLVHLAQTLVNQQLLTFPRVSFAEGVDANQRQIVSQMMSRLHGQVVSPDGSPTHVVYPDSPGWTSPATPQYFRPVARLANHVLVHWLTLPASYDTWKAMSTRYNAEITPLVAPHSGPYHVPISWVTDSSKYNEWMEEEDYEEALSSSQEAGHPTGTKRRFPVPTSEENEPLATEETHPKLESPADNHPTQEAEPADTIMMDAQPEHPKLSMVDINDPDARANAPGKKSEFEPLPTGDLANISHTESSLQIPKSPSPAEKLEEEAETLAVAAEDANAMDAENVVATLEDQSSAPSQSVEVKVATPPPALSAEEIQSKAKSYLVQQTYEVIIPSYAAWFSMDRIHPNEKRGLPEFFNGRNRSKTPSVYKDYRDFMINTYRLNPHEYLTVTACRRNLAGDVCAIMRVHAFLEQWGLINYQVDPDTRPSVVGPPFTGHFRITADTPRGLQPFLPSITVANASGKTVHPVSGEATAKAQTESTTDGSALNLALRKHVYDDPASQDKESSGDATNANTASGAARYHCFTCGVECTRLRYHCLKVKKVDLCPPCYLEGRFPSSLYSGDFVKLEASQLKQTQGGSWSEQETLLLLEGIEMFDNDWFRIADHVGTRTREQCISHFLQLPIEDPYLETSMSELGPLQYHQNVPFSQANNPVLSVVAFLAANVNPGVAAAAAQSALKELATGTKSKKEDTTRPEATTDAKPDPDRKEDEPVATGSPTSGSTHDTQGALVNGMDVDASVPDAPQTVPTADRAASPPPAAPVNGAATSPAFNKTTITKASMAALGAAAAKAQVLAQHEEGQIQSLVQQAIESQLKKLELKMREFEELEAFVRTQQAELENERLKLVQERWQVRKTLLALQEKQEVAKANPATTGSVSASAMAVDPTHQLTNPTNGASSTNANTPLGQGNPGGNVSVAPHPVEQFMSQNTPDISASDTPETSASMTFD
ncbi:SWI/SNF and RSC complex subunit Ssr2 [Dispira parvispora]|uniref:SWI/SNF and RSC complex subunit Ssr2 n=1 Tax=Dispira parvispora TaxID=1520584 RepID=A0A9W8AQF0_9FUNG|nr:SWI/SNF and RSC complex subunit Ssr2 [Dispira parvispora]